MGHVDRQYGDLGYCLGAGFPLKLLEADGAGFTVGQRYHTEVADSGDEH